jgi:hypothetical protein
MFDAFFVLATGRWREIARPRPCLVGGWQNGSFRQLGNVGEIICTEKVGLHKLLTGGGLLLIADINPDMSASILAGSDAVSDLERVSRDLSDSGR